MYAFYGIGHMLNPQGCGFLWNFQQPRRPAEARILILPSQHMYLLINPQTHHQIPDQPYFVEKQQQG